MKMKLQSDKFPPTIASYYKDISKVFSKYTSVKKPSDKNTAGSSAKIPADGYDICNYVAKYGMANFQIQAVMKLDGRLDYNTLIKAVELLIDAEPVLGCGFIKSHRPYWKRFDDNDDVNFCSIEVAENTDEAVERFLESPLHMDNSPMFAVKLIRSGKYDTLGVKINHVCSDAAGAKRLIELLSDIYSRIDHGDNDFAPNPSIRSKKEHFALLKVLDEDDPDTTWDPQQQVAFSTWKFPWKNGRKGSTGFAVSKLPYGSLNILNSYAKSRDATINDLILTAIFRAMFEISKPPYGVPMDIPITIDLRRFLPEHKAEAIRNFSGGLVIKMDRKAHESFEGTLSRIMSATKKIKTGHPSAKNARMAEYIEKMNFHQICAYFKGMSQVIEFAAQNPFYNIDMCSPVLSNFGFVSKSLIKFGNNTVTEAYIIPPVVRAPGILLVASTYNGIITLAVGYYKPSVRKAVMQGLLNKIKDELVEGCKQ